MKLVWIVIPLVLFGVIGISDSFAMQSSSPFIATITIDSPPKLNDLGEIILQIKPRFPSLEHQNIFNYSTSFNIPEGFELISGQQKSQHDWNSQQPLEVKLKVKAIQTGNWTFDGFGNSGATVDSLYLSVFQNKAYVNNEQFSLKGTLSPKKQLELGIAPEDIICKEGLQLIFKYSDNSPACVKPLTAEKLIERGWTIDKIIPISEIILDVSKYYDKQVKVTGELSKGIAWPELRPPVCFNICHETIIKKDYAVAGAYWVLSDENNNQIAVWYETPSDAVLPHFGQWNVTEEYLEKSVLVTGIIKPTVRSVPCACSDYTSAYLLLDSIEAINIRR